MKNKIVTIIIVLLLSLTLVSCKEYRYYDMFESMNSLIRVEINDKNVSEEEKKKYLNDIKEMFDDYHKLSDNFKTYSKINNIKYINDNPNLDIEIDERLYNILVEAEKLKEYTNGYFDISIGKIIDEWKQLEKYSESIDETLKNKEMTKEDYHEKMTEKIKEIENNVSIIEVIKDGIKLWSEEDKFYINIKDGVKIDLGAISKGYVVGLAEDYLKSKDLKYFKIEGSESSIYYGYNNDPKRENEQYIVGLRKNNLNYFGALHLKDVNLSSSGDLVSFYVDKLGKSYHHIISPKTKRPENYYKRIVVLHENGGVADALSTALYSMPLKELEKWLEDKKEELIIYTDDERVITYLEDPSIFTIDI